MRRGNNYSGARWAFSVRPRKPRGRPRKRGTCPTCSRVIAVMGGSGPYADGRGHVLPHKAGGRACPGGLAVDPISEPQDDDAPACYVRGCGAIEDLEEAGFPGQSLWVCPECKASQGHQRALSEEFATERSEG